MFVTNLKPGPVREVHEKSFEMDTHPIIDLDPQSLKESVVHWTVEAARFTKFFETLANQKKVTESARACSYFSVRKGMQSGAVAFLTPHPCQKVSGPCEVLAESPKQNKTYDSFDT